MPNISPARPHQESMDIGRKPLDRNKLTDYVLIYRLLTVGYLRKYRVTYRITYGVSLNQFSIMLCWTSHASQQPGQSPFAILLRICLASLIFQICLKLLLRIFPSFTPKTRHGKIFPIGSSMNERNPEKQDVICLPSLRKCLMHPSI